MITDRDPGDEQSEPLVRCAVCERWMLRAYLTCDALAFCRDCQDATWAVYGPRVARLPATSAPLSLPEASA